MYKEQIINFCSSLGLDSIGFTDCRIYYELEEFFINRKKSWLENTFEEENIGKRINPFIYMEKGKTIISIAFPYLYSLKGNNNIYFSRYTYGRDYHKVVSSYLDKICQYIRSLGGEAVGFVDSNALPERYIAKLCGVGFLGKNGMLINPKYGSFIFLGEIITNLEVESDASIKEMCGSCEKCYKACPTKSISKEGCNPNICLSYITQKKDLEEEWFKKLDGRLFGCDTCQLVCPHNQGIAYSKLTDFIPFDFMEEVYLEELLYINNNEFNGKYKHTSCGWRGKSVLQRNAIINALAKNNFDKIDVNRINSPYVIEYYNRLLKSLKL